MKTSVIQLLINDVDVFAEISQLHHHDIQHKDGQVGFYTSTTLPHPSPVGNHSNQYTSAPATSHVAGHLFDQNFTGHSPSDQRNSQTDADGQTDRQTQNYR